MSTPCEVILYTHNKALADKTAKAVLHETKRLEKKYNYYDTTSLLSQINYRKTNKLDSETKSILQRAKQYYKLTNGIFDITIATIKHLYTNELNLKDFEIQKAKLTTHVGCEHFEIKKNKIFFDNEFTKLDLGGFVKEYAVDRAILVIKKHKITSALVNFGGDIYALGKKPDGSKYKLAIKNPLDTTKFVTEVDLENQALTTSASYERNYKIDGTIYSHILSKTNIPSENPNSVSVVSTNCVESGIFSTSIMIDKTIQTTNRTIVI